MLSSDCKNSRCSKKFGRYSSRLFSVFSRFGQKKSERSNRKKILPTSWRSQTPSKTPSTHPPDQAKWIYPSLDAYGRLETIFLMVYASLIEKNRPLRGLNGSSGRKCFIGWYSGKSALNYASNVLFSITWRILMSRHTPPSHLQKQCLMRSLKVLRASKCMPRA